MTLNFKQSQVLQTMSSLTVYGVMHSVLRASLQASILPKPWSFFLDINSHLVNITDLASAALLEDRARNKHICVSDGVSVLGKTILSHCQRSRRNSPAFGETHAVQPIAICRAHNYPLLYFCCQQLAGQIRTLPAAVSKRLFVGRGFWECEYESVRGGGRSERVRFVEGRRPPADK